MRYWIAVILLLLSVGISAAQDAQTPYEIAQERIAEAEATDSMYLGLEMLALSSRTIRAFEKEERLPDLPTLSMLIQALCRDSYEAQQLLQSWEKASKNRNFKHSTTIS